MAELSVAADGSGGRASNETGFRPWLIDTTPTGEEVAKAQALFDLSMKQVAEEPKNTEVVHTLASFYMASCGGARWCRQNFWGNQKEGGAIAALAIDLLRKPQQDEEKKLDAHFCLAHCGLARMGDGDRREKVAIVQEAVSHIQACLAIRPQEPKLHLFMATMLARCGSSEQAQQEAKKALSLAEEEHGKVLPSSLAYILWMLGTILINRSSEDVTFRRRGLEMVERFVNEADSAHWMYPTAAHVLTTGLVQREAYRSLVGPEDAVMVCRRLPGLAQKVMMTYRKALDAEAIAMKWMPAACTSNDSNLRKMREESRSLVKTLMESPLLSSLPKAALRLEGAQPSQQQQQQQQVVKRKRRTKKKKFDPTWQLTPNNFKGVADLPPSKLHRRPREAIVHVVYHKRKGTAVWPSGGRSFGHDPEYEGVRYWLWGKYKSSDLEGQLRPWDIVVLLPGEYLLERLGLPEKLDFPMEIMGVNGPKEQIVITTRPSPSDWVLRLAPPHGSVTYRLSNFTLKPSCITREGIVLIQPGYTKHLVPLESNCSAVVEMDGVDIHGHAGSGFAVRLYSGAHLEASNCLWRSVTGSALEVRDFTSCLLQDCEMTETGLGTDKKKRQPPGMPPSHKGQWPAVSVGRSTSVCMRNCHIHDNEGFAVQYQREEDFAVMVNEDGSLVPELVSSLKMASARTGADYDEMVISVRANALRSRGPGEIDIAVGGEGCSSNTLERNALDTDPIGDLPSPFHALETPLGKLLEDEREELERQSDLVSQQAQQTQDEQEAQEDGEGKAEQGPTL